MRLDSGEWHILQLGPLWVLSALAGTHTRFEPYELEAFWDAVVAVSLRTPEPARQILVSTAADRTGLLLDFELDDRPVVSGLAHILAVLSRQPPATGEDYKLALLRIGSAVARARGPYGRKIAAKDHQLLLLIATLLDVDSLPRPDGVPV